jgi:hypothetical protein
LIHGKLGRVKIAYGIPNVKRWGGAIRGRELGGKRPPIKRLWPLVTLNFELST